MKKTLLSIIAVILCGLSAFAQSEMFYTAGGLRALPARPSTNGPLRATTVSGEMEFKYYGDITEGVYPLGFNGQTAGMEICNVICIPAEKATELAGNKITAISFCTGFTGGSKFLVQTGQVWLSNSLGGATVASAGAKILGQEGQLMTVTLPEPYTIEAGKPVYIGATSVIGGANDLTVVTDAVPTENSNASIVGYRMSSKGAWQWTDAGAYGSLVVSATIAGDNLPGDMASVVGFSVPAVANVATPFTFKATVENAAANPIENIELQYTIGESEPVLKEFSFAEQPLGYLDRATVEISDAQYPTAGASVPVKAWISKINGTDNNLESVAETTLTLLPEGAGFQRAVVIEDYTGTWCPNCPRGIYAIDLLKEQAEPGTFIPVAIHGGDEMQSSSCNSLLNLVSGYPTFIINRGYADYVPGYPDETIAYYNEIKAIPAIAKVEATANISEDLKKIEFTVKSTFALDEENAPYRLAFMVTEDDVLNANNGSMYIQQNNLSGGKTGMFGPWESRPQYYQMLFQDVARYYSGGLQGTQNSVPASITAGQTYEYSSSFTINSTIKRVNDITKTGLVVYLLDSRDGSLVNATMVPYADVVKPDGAGISDILTDSESPVEYFNLQGIRVAEPSRGGVYIRRQGLKAEKILF